MKAIILAGGKGTRLYPYTTVFPKPLVPIDDKPIIEIMLHQLKHHGIQSITISVGHLAELLTAFLGNGEKLGLEIDYVREDKPLGTVGPLALIKDLPDNFFLMNGDILTDIDYTELYQFHLKHQAAVTISSYVKKIPVDLGVLVTEGDRLTDYIEKPVKTFEVSMGIYVFNKSVAEFVPENEYFDFPSLIKVLLQKGKKVMTYKFDGLWMDIGRPSDYDEAQNTFKSLRHRILKE